MCGIEFATHLFQNSNKFFFFFFISVWNEVYVRKTTFNFPLSLQKTLHVTRAERFPILARLTRTRSRFLQLVPRDHTYTYHSCDHLHSVTLHVICAIN